MRENLDTEGAQVFNCPEDLGKSSLLVSNFLRGAGTVKCAPPTFQVPNVDENLEH
jgi:hypothetical protein